MALIHKESKHPIIIHKLTLGQRWSDKLTAAVGSWSFIIGLFIFVFIWMGINTLMVLFNVWDPYPFILLNFMLSCLATIQAPIILMSQNRESQKDRIRFEYDYIVNRKAEKEIQDIQRDLEIIKKLLRK